MNRPVLLAIVSVGRLRWIVLSMRPGTPLFVGLMRPVLTPLGSWTAELISEHLARMRRRMMSLVTVVVLWQRWVLGVVRSDTGSLAVVLGEAVVEGVEW